MKGKMYKTVVRSAMLYALEALPMKKRQEAELEAGELVGVRGEDAEGVAKWRQMICCDNP